MFFKTKVRTTICAEAGIAHSGQLSTAIDLIHAAKDCGADVVKFQYYLTDVLCIDRDCFNAYDILKKNETKGWWIPILKKECDKIGIRFSCTSFCKSTAEELNPYVDSFKIASPEATNIGFLKFVAKYGKPIIISTGRTTQEQLDRIFKEVDADISLLYCKSLYPAQISDYDLREIERLRKRYGVPTGLSDHTTTIETSIKASQEWGAFLVERHFMLDNMDCVDKSVSITPNEFKEMVQKIKGGIN